MSALSPETQAAYQSGIDAVMELATQRDDLVILTAYMADGVYGADEIAYAVEKPWKFADVLAEAKAALTGSESL